MSLGGTPAHDAPSACAVCGNGELYKKKDFPQWLGMTILTVALYSTDASIFQIQPAGIAVPADEDDVQALVRYAAEHKLTLIARGAGTGLAGESLGSGLIVDLSRHFRSILDIGAESVRVQ